VHWETTERICLSLLHRTKPEINTLMNRRRASDVQLKSSNHECNAENGLVSVMWLNGLKFWCGAMCIQLFCMHCGRFLSRLILCSCHTCYHSWIASLLLPQATTSMAAFCCRVDVVFWQHLTCKLAQIGPHAHVHFQPPWPCMLWIMQILLYFHQKTSIRLIVCCTVSVFFCTLCITKEWALVCTLGQMILVNSHVFGFE